MINVVRVLLGGSFSEGRKEMCKQVDACLSSVDIVNHLSGCSWFSDIEKVQPLSSQDDSHTSGGVAILWEVQLEIKALPSVVYAQLFACAVVAIRFLCVLVRLRNVSIMPKVCYGFHQPLLGPPSPAKHELVGH